MGPGIHLLPAIEKPHVSLAAEKLFSIGPINVTNSMLTMFIVMIVLVIFFAYANRKIASGRAEAVRAAPRGAQNFAEFVVETLLGLVENTAGKQLGRRILALVATLFIFILTANYAGLLPGVGTIGFCEHEAAKPAEGRVALVASSVPLTASGAVTAADETQPGAGCSNPGEVLVPFLRAPNADLNMTIAMALIAVTTVQIMGIRAHGAGGYLKEFINPLHLIGEFSRIISLSARLFGNIFGGEVLLAVIIALTGALYGLLGIIPAIFYGLELFFGFIQALLFSLLTLIYIAVAAAGHGDHGAHEEHGPIGALEHGAEELAV
jgi:F-type H+-transporting ATPase subunit a